MGYLKSYLKTFFSAIKIFAILKFLYLLAYGDFFSIYLFYNAAIAAIAGPVGMIITSKYYEKNTS